jgi:hypothetical protein
MRVAWIQGCTVVVAAALALLLAAPLRAADETGVRTAAEELGSRTKTPDAPAGAPKGLSDSAVRVMSTFALSILPDEIPNGSGGKMKLDKSDPNKYLIPLDDARAVIKVATRSAYAEACGLRELEKANFETLVRAEQARLVWSKEQMMFIEALHTFATSYFAGNVKITEQPADDAAAAKDAPAQAKDDPAAAKAAAPAQAKDDAAAAKAAAPAETITSKKLLCSPEQKEKVTQAIGAYVQAAPPATPTAAAPAAPQAGTPAPVAGGAN